MTALLPVYNRVDLQIAYGKGSYLYGRDGKRYVDFAAGVAVNCLGHCHPAVVEALRVQSQKLWHVSNLWVIPEAEALADRYCSRTFADKVFFCNSGAEAVEGVIKTIRKYQHFHGREERNRIITFAGAFHGRTLATLWASKRDAYMQEGFGPAVDGFDRVEFNDLEAVKAAVTSHTAGVLVEPAQGDGGVRPASREFLQGLRALCDEHGLLLGFDEVQIGFGRSGCLYAYEHYGVTPDVMATAKGAGGGFPFGAFMASEKAAAGMTAGSHGSTYGGNPLACHVGATVFDIVSDPAFLAEVKVKAAYLTELLEGVRQEFPEHVSETRGLGLLRGLKLGPKGGEAKTAFREIAALGLLLAPAADNVLRVLPPLNVEHDVLDEAADILRGYFRSRA